MSDVRTYEVAGHTVEVARPDKELLPAEDGGGPSVTKADLADHLLAVADRILPFLERRPLSLQRIPDGLQAGDFYQKKRPDHFPTWLGDCEVPLAETGGSQHQVCVDDAAGLVFLADQAVITPHPWLARADDLDHPDRLVLDLDPPGEDFSVVRDAARLLRTILDGIGLTAHVMTTGSRGLHVVVPLDRTTDFATVRGLARGVCERAADRDPDRLTVAMRKDAREGRLFLDYLRNARGQTAVAPYAVRALPGGPVATPLDWDELGDGRLHARRYHVGNLQRRLSRKNADPWRGFWRHAASAERAAARL
jgi:bifunctional non-homologous end joining protein LigD